MAQPTFSPESVNNDFQDFSEKNFPLSEKGQNPGQSDQPQTGKNAGDEVSSAFKGGLAKTKEGFQGVADAVNEKNPVKFFESGLKFGAGTVDTVTAPLAPVLSPVGAAINKIGDHLSNLPWLQKFANSKAGDITSRVVEDVANADTIAGAATASMEAPEAVDYAQDLYNKHVDQVMTRNAISDVTPDLKSAQADKFQTIPVDENGIPTTPDKGVSTIPRVTGDKTAKVNNTALELDASKALKNSPAWQEVFRQENLVGGNTARARFNAVAQELPGLNKQLLQDLDTSNTPVNRVDVLNKFESDLNSTDNSLGGKTKAAKIANREINNTVEQLLMDGTPNTAGIVRARQGLDAAYQKFKGDFPVGTETRSAYDQAYVKARNSLNQQAIDLEKNVDIKARLKNEWDLHRAADALQDKADQEAPTAIGRWAQRHPVISGLGKYGARRAIFRGLMHP